MKKAALFLSALLLAQLILPACSSGTENAAEGAQDSVVSAPGDPAVESEAPPETDLYEHAMASLPSETFGGREFNILTRGNELYEMDVEELTGETTNDSIYNRNRSVEDTFDIHLAAFNAGNWDAVSDKMRASVTAGDNLYSLVGQVDFKTYAIVGNGTCGNWLDIPVIDFDAPWWTKAANDEATINGKLFSFTGDYCITNILYGNVLFYNAGLGDRYGHGAASLQETVFEKKWTLDALRTIVSDVYEDTNGNTSRDEADTYGIALAGDAHCDEWLTAFAQPLTTVNDAGQIEVVMFTDKTVSALEQVMALYYENPGTFYAGSWKTDVALKLFAEDRAFFTAGLLNDARTTFAGMESDFGVLPFPMWDEAQDTYYTVASDQFTVLAFPINTPESDYGYLGTIVEAMGVLSKRDVVPAFYDSALKNRYSMDANTAKIIDLIMDGRLFEFSFQYGNEFELPYMFRNQILAGSNDIMSAYASKQKAIGKAIDKIAKYYGIGD